MNGFTVEKFSAKKQKTAIAAPETIRIEPTKLSQSEVD